MDGAVMIENYDSVDVFVGVDVGKGEHHAVALNRLGKVVFDKALPNDEARMRAVFQKLKTHGTVLVVVDQPATIGALPIAVAQTEGVLVGYLPELAMRRSSRRLRGRCRTHCGRSSWPMNLSPSCRCFAASTTTSSAR
jgi:hypothetical protein